MTIGYFDIFDEQTSSIEIGKRRRYFICVPSYQRSFTSAIYRSVKLYEKFRNSPFRYYSRSAAANIRALHFGMRSMRVFSANLQFYIHSRASPRS